MIQHGFRTLMVGSDTASFDKESAVFSRLKDYSAKMKDLYVIVFSLKKDGFAEISDSEKNLHIIPTNSSSRLMYFFDAIKIGKKIIKKNGFSINSSALSCQDPFESGIVGLYLKSKFHLPLQIQVHTDFLSPYFKNSFLNRVRVFISRFTIHKSNNIRVVSSVIKESIEKKFPKMGAKISILPIFVDLEGIEKTLEGNSLSQNKFSKDFFMFSRLSKEKRFDIALLSFKKVVENFPDAGLTIFGSGKEKGNIEKMITELDLEGNVILNEPKINTEILSDFKRDQGIFLLTSEFEGYGMTLIEAGVSGFPVVTTKVGIAKTSLFESDKNCFMCEVGDVDCIAKSMIDFITNEEKRKSFGNNLRVSIKNISTNRDVYVSQYVGLLESILKK